MSPRPIEFRSDNSAGVAPEVLAAVAAANDGTTIAYGADEWTARLHEVATDVFEHPVSVFPVPSGTAANALALAAACPPWGAVLCHETAHILRSECGATSLFSGGAVMRAIPGANYRIEPTTFAAALGATRWGDPHESQPSVLSLTCPSDFGTIYTPADVAALHELADARAMRMHLDGARLANAVAALGCTPAELTWKSGIDLLSLGAIKNGGMTCDAIVCFDESLADALTYRVKRAGHVASKMRYHSAQLIAYLTDGLWLRLAGNANAMMTRLVTGLRALGVETLNDPQVNMAFVRLDDAAIPELAKSGLLFYTMGPGTIRLVTNFATTEDDIDEALGRFSAALS